jgi:hypothetical protein
MVVNTGHCEEIDLFAHIRHITSTLLHDGKLCLQNSNKPPRKHLIGDPTLEGFPVVGMLP